MATWSKDELDYLQSNYGKLDSLKIGKQLKRSSNAIRHKAQRLGLAEKRKFWDEDDEIYLEYFAFEKDSKLNTAAKFLGRSTNAVGLRLSALRDGRNDYYYYRPWTSKDDDYLKDNYRYFSYKVIALRLDRSQKAVTERARRLGLKKYKSIKVVDKEIRKLASQKMCPTDIARVLNIKPGNLLDYLKKHEISYRPLTSEESLNRAREKSPWHIYKLDFRTNRKADEKCLQQK